MSKSLRNKKPPGSLGGWFGEGFGWFWDFFFGGVLECVLGVSGFYESEVGVGAMSCRDALVVQRSVLRKVMRGDDGSHFAFRVPKSELRRRGPKDTNQFLVVEAASNLRETHQERSGAKPQTFPDVFPGGRRPFRPPKSTNPGFYLSAPFGAAPFYGYPSICSDGSRRAAFLGKEGDKANDTIFVSCHCGPVGSSRTWSALFSCAVYVACGSDVALFYAVLFCAGQCKFDKEPVLSFWPA
jgi:hypothetical protein